MTTITSIVEVGTTTFTIPTDRPSGYKYILTSTSVCTVTIPQIFGNNFTFVVVNGNGLAHTFSDPRSSMMINGFSSGGVSSFSFGQSFPSGSASLTPRAGQELHFRSSEGKWFVQAYFIDAEIFRTVACNILNATELNVAASGARVTGIESTVPAPPGDNVTLANTLSLYETFLFRDIPSGAAYSTHPSPGVANAILKQNGTSNMLTSTALRVDSSNNLTGVVGVTATGAIQGSNIRAPDANNNVAFGHGLVFASGASQNTLIGATAGDSITTGDDNVLIGWNAGTALTTNARVVAIGSSAVGTSTGAANTVGIGWNCFAAVTGASNTGIGYNCGTALTSGAGNTLIGVQAGLSVTTGSHNTLIGAQAGDAIATSTSGNTIVGSQSDCSSGANNTLIGYNVLSLTTGASNVAVGQGITFDTGARANCLLLGSGVTSTASNEIRLGNASHTALAIPMFAASGPLQTSATGGITAITKGTVTQITNNNTAVTIANQRGAITMFGTIAAGAAHAFVVNCTSVDTLSSIFLSVNSVSAGVSPQPSCHAAFSTIVDGTSFIIHITNSDAASATAAAPVIHYMIVDPN